MCHKDKALALGMCVCVRIPDADEITGLAEGFEGPLKASLAFQ